MTVDPLKNLKVSSENYDIHRKASIYYNSDASMAWTKAWFNDRDKPEEAVPVSVSMAWALRTGKISLDEWLTRYFPKQMDVYNKVMDETRKQLLGL